MNRTQIQSTLNYHLTRKAANATWLFDCIQGDVKKFPYRISKSGKGRVLHNTLCYPRNQSTINPTRYSKATARFVINIPEGRAATSYSSNKTYTSMLKRLKCEAFSTVGNGSSRMFKSRACVVVGTNQVESLDNRVNQAFKWFIQRTPPIDGIACRRFGFLWRPEYTCTENAMKPYRPTVAFFLLRMLSDTQARRVQKHLETPEKIRKQVPYQDIRQTILMNGLTRGLTQAMQQSAPTSPIYLSVMDADFLKLRKGYEQGLFGKISQVVSPHRPISVIGTGYSTAKRELPIIRLAVTIDIAVRVAMTRVIPYSAYLPEPLLCVLLRRPNQNHHLAKLSFVGRGTALESRRLIENGKREDVLNDHMTFLPDGPVTTSPDRWKTKKNKTYTRLTTGMIKTEEVLKALHGLSQSHAIARKWALQVYCAIDFSCSRVTDATMPMQHIFGVFDPISRMFSAEGSCSSSVFDRVLRDYESNLTTVQTDVLNSAKLRLRILGMERELVDKIVAAAKASGSAIYKELQKATQVL